MKRYELSASQWRKIEGFLPGRPGSVGVTPQDNRQFVNRVLWILRSGTHWKHLPAEYGNWKSVHQRFTRWAKAGIWEHIFQVLLADPNNTYIMIDSTIVRAHQQAVWGKGEPTPGFGASRGGLSTKIHLVTDAQGQPIRFSVTGGQAHDAPQAIPLLTSIKAEGVIGDKGYDSDQILNFIQRQGAIAVIPPKSNRKAPREYDRELYKQRNLIERTFNKLKHWRRIATRYELS
jgi:transposase